MRTVFLVPRRDDHGHRDRLWAYCRRRWEDYFPDVPVYEGHHNDGPFNRAAAVNTAARLADADGRWDLGIVIDSDVFLRVSDVRAAIESAAKSGRITWPHTRWRELREDWTARVLREPMDLGPEPTRDDMDLMVGVTNPISWSCCMVVPRAVWDDIGGMDERFRGWGWEDMAWQSLVVGLYGYDRLPGDVLNLWHERSPERIIKGQPRTTATEAYITNARLGRRYMMAARRDHNVHDRVAPGDEAERQRDMRNIVADDRKWAESARQHGLPNWDEWWPTLEELRDGAKSHRAGPAASVALIVRTGGSAENWPERSAYLRQSLASLEENVTGPVVMRRLYSDWGQAHHAELVEIGEAHGYKVVGPTGHVGYTPAVQKLWAYIDRNVAAPFVFLTEDDFLYDKPIDLAGMVETMESDPALHQLALLRGPVFPREMTSGGILGWPVDDFTRRDAPHPRLEHRLFWTMNPSLIRRSVVKREWPSADSSERVFGDLLFSDPAAKVAFWGTEASTTHIGETRAVKAGAGY